MKFKKPTFPMFFRKLNKKSGGLSSPAGGGDAADDFSGRWSFKGSTTGLRWKRRPTVFTWFVDGFVFKVVYVVEAVVMVVSLGFFYLCCGCRL